jgi:hypothetical protein
MSVGVKSGSSPHQHLQSVRICSGAPLLTRWQIPLMKFCQRRSARKHADRVEWEAVSLLKASLSLLGSVSMPTMAASKFSTCDALAASRSTASTPLIRISTTLNLMSVSVLVHAGHLLDGRHAHVMAPCNM